jgi:CcmD family protein
MSELAWLFVGLLAVWLGIGGYILTIAVRQRRLEQRLDEVTRRR